MSAGFLVLLLLGIGPAVPSSTRGELESVVPRHPHGYASGTVAVRIRTVEVPGARSPGLTEGLALRTGVAATAIHGVRIEVVVPRDVQFTRFRAIVADGLVVRPTQRSWVGKLGRAVVSVLRILLFGHVVSAAEGVSIPGAAFSAAIGAPTVDDEMVELSTGRQIEVERGHTTFSDHGSFAVCRAVLALTPWTELVQIRIEGLDRTTGKTVEFHIPRVTLRGDAPTGEPVRTLTARAGG